MASYATLNSKRAAYLGQITKITNAVTAFDPELQSINVLKGLSKNLATVLGAHQDIINALMDHPDADFEAITDQIDVFRSAHVDATALAHDKIEELRDKGESNDMTLLNGELEALNFHLKEFENFVASCNMNCITVHELKMRNKHLDPLHGRYIDIWHQVIKRVNETRKEELKIERDNFVKSYFATISWFNREIELKSPITNEPHYSNPNHRLPKIELPTFDGSPDAWIAYRDAFRSIVHNVPSIPGSLKFRYLKSSIVDKNSPINHLLESDEGYEEAWQAVVEFYDDQRRIVDCHFSGMLSVKYMNAETHEELQRVLNEFSLHIASLERMYTEQELYRAFLAHLVIRRLDPHTRDLWETENKGNIPFWPDLQRFLKERRKTLSSMPAPKTIAKPAGVAQTKTILQKSNAKSANVHATSKSSGEATAHNAQENNSQPSHTQRCLMCGGEHRLNACNPFLILTIAQRYAKVKEWRVCTNCFGNHYAKACTSKYRCRSCQKPHNTLLHNFQNPQDSSSTPVTQPPQQPPQSQLQVNAPTFPFKFPAANCNTANTKGSSVTLLQTAIVHIQDAFGVWHCARAFLDTGSDSNYITKSVATALKLPLESTYVEANGLGGTRAAVIKQKVSVLLGNKKENFSMIFLVTPKVTNPTPQISINPNILDIPLNLPLADPSFHVPGKIDILIGNEWYGHLLRDGLIRLGKGPVLLNSIFGWLISGCAPSSSHNASHAFHMQSQTHHATTKQRQNVLRQDLSKNSDSFGESLKVCVEKNSKNGKGSDGVEAIAHCNHTTLIDLRNSIEKFYKLEDYRNDKRFLTDEEAYCEEFFQQTFRRLPSGRLVLTIPLKESIDQLTNNYRMALCQFLANEKRLQKNPQLLASYIKFMREYESLGHMTKIDISHEAHDAPAFYFPHHAVEKPDSSTTDTRTVFNGSARTASGLSFNDCQCVGPQIQCDIFSLSLQFRQHLIVIKADIAKMYRQFEIAEHQRKYQRILWRESPQDPICVYSLNTVTYGTASASHLTSRGLKQLAIENQQNFPKAAEEIINKFYVDDYISGAPSVREAISLAQDVSKIISSGEMKLRKFNSNSIEFLNAIPEEDREVPKADTAIKALGIKWDPINDTIEFDIKPISSNKITRRTILSEVSRIYDPEGLLGPVTFTLKLFLKYIVQLSTPWDKPLTDHHAECWTAIARTFSELNKVRIPRHCLVANFTEVQMHGFCDASDLGYGAAVYLRSKNDKGKIMCHLICSKSRIAPTEYRSTARLELCGIVILAHLMRQASKAFNINFSKKFCWSDSAIALQWLKKAPAQLQIFVANRVSEVQEISREDSLSWFHIAGIHNPADQLSRGINPSDIIENSSWWNGPEFLMTPERQWSKPIVTVDPIDKSFVQEFKKIETSVYTASAAHFPNPFMQWMESSSRSWTAKRKLAHVMRFIHNTRARSNNEVRRSGSIQVNDMLDAEHAFARIYQANYFRDEFHRCADKRFILNNSPIKNLDPFWDSNLKLMRVGGRLNLSQHCDANQKHPIILPKCHFSRLIIRETHQANLHAGQKTTQSLVRLRYWPIRAMDTVRLEVRNCIKCFRARPRMVKQFMGQLPIDRITPSPVFYNTGVDYCGPFDMKVSQIRNAKTRKIYVALFVCLATKAIHMEVVSELSTQAFFAAFDKFTSRRGLPHTMHSDNGLNFVGARNDMRELFEYLSLKTTQEEIRHYLTQHEIEWHFIPPRAPEHGGLWEAGVKSMKHHFNRVAKNALLTFEEFDRLKSRIEAVLNSRPLTAISHDPSDFSALTTGHFLIGRPLVAKPEKDLTQKSINRLERWERVILMQQQFWTRWSREYLHQLQVRTKNFKEKVPVKVGQLVLLHIDHLPSMQWPLGRITNIYPGKDGVTRVASVRTAKSVYERPVTKLALLPIDFDDQLVPAEDVRD